MTDNGAPKREDNQLIAAEYVLGVLGVSEWREVEQRIAGDQIFAREVAFWEEPTCRGNSCCRASGERLGRASRQFSTGPSSRRQRVQVYGKASPFGEALL